MASPLSSRARRLMEESNENDATSPLPSPLSRSPLISLPRSPLVSILNSWQTPESAKTTSKSAASRVSSRSFSERQHFTEPRGTTRERTSSQSLQSIGNFGLVEQLVVAPCFEDISLWSDHSVQVNHEEVTEKLETCVISAESILSKFDEAQETMAEAELVLFSLLRTTETARGERDSVIESQFLFLEEFTYAVSSIEEYFHEIKRITTEELGGVRADIVVLVKELNEWIEKSRAIFINFPLRRDIERTNEMIQSFLYDLSLLQEWTSSKSSTIEKYKEILEKMQKRQEVLNMENFSLRSELEKQQKLCLTFVTENNELHVMLEEEVLKGAQTEEMLEEKSMVIDGLEKEKQTICEQREQLDKEVLILKSRCEMAMALAEEREVTAVKATETSKMYAEEKEQEVKILEHSIGELEATIDVLREKNLVDREHLENLLVKSHQQAEELKAKDVEILNLMAQVDQLVQERDSLVEDMNQGTNQLVVEELEQKENLLATIHKMLKMDRANLQKRIFEMDEAIELLAASSSAPRLEGYSRNEAIEEFKKRVEESDVRFFLV